MRSIVIDVCVTKDLDSEQTSKDVKEVITASIFHYFSGEKTIFVSWQPRPLVQIEGGKSRCKVSTQSFLKTNFKGAKELAVAIVSSVRLALPNQQAMVSFHDAENFCLYAMAEKRTEIIPFH